MSNNRNPRPSLWEQFNPGVDGKPPIPARKALPWIAAICTAVAVAAACTPEEEATPATSSAIVSQPAQSAEPFGSEGVGVETEPPAKTLPKTGQSDTEREAIFYRYLDSEGVTIADKDAKLIARAACSTLRQVAEPDSGMVDVSLYGIIAAVQEDHPSLTDDDAAHLIGAGSTIWCPEYSDAFGDSGR